MNIEELKTEIAKLKVDLAGASVADKPILQEELTRMQDELKTLTTPAQPASVDTTSTTAPPAATTPPPTAVASTPQETAVMSPEDKALMDEARAETGENSHGNFPSAPKVRIDNQKVIKEVDGEKLEGKPLQRFINVKKEGEQWVTIDLGPQLSGVILKVRRFIKEKYDEANPKKMRFQSYEYNQGDIIRVFTGQMNAPVPVFQGTEGQCVQQFATGELNSANKPKVCYDKYAMVYMLVPANVAIGETEPKMIKFETKISVKDHPLWTYLFAFGEEDTFLAYTTNITLEWLEVNSIVKFWKPVFTKGERSNLKENLGHLRELNKLFDIMDAKTQPHPAGEIPTPEEDVPMIDNPSMDNGMQTDPDPDEIEINVDDIPF